MARYNRDHLGHLRDTKTGNVLVLTTADRDILASLADGLVRLERADSGCVTCRLVDRLFDEVAGAIVADRFGDDEAHKVFVRYCPKDWDGWIKSRLTAA